jgi:hypothetical protein
MSTSARLTRLVRPPLMLPLGALLAALLVLACGAIVLRHVRPAPEPPQRSAQYGDFGGPGNPYGETAPAAGKPALAGAFSDQRPLPSVPPPSSMAGVNGGSRGFPPESLTVNQSLPTPSAPAASP